MALFVNLLLRQKALTNDGSRRSSKAHRNRLTPDLSEVPRLEYLLIPGDLNQTSNDHSCLTPHYPKPVRGGNFSRREADGETEVGPLDRTRLGSSEAFV